MLEQISGNELMDTDGGIVITTTTLVICAVSSFGLGCVFGAGVYTGYSNAGK